MEAWRFEDLAYVPDPDDADDCIQVTLIRQEVTRD